MKVKILDQLKAYPGAQSKERKEEEVLKLASVAGKSSGIYNRLTRASSSSRISS